MKKAVISRRYLGVVFIVLAMAIIPAAAKADVTYTLDTLLSGFLPPSGAPPWVQATFHDAGGGVVDLTMQVLNLNNREHVGHWYFDVADAYAGNLTFSLTNPLPPFANHYGSPFTSDPNTPTSALNGFPLPVGTFDIDMFFHNEFLGAANASTLNDHVPEVSYSSVTYEITSSVAGLQASSFNVLDSTGKQYTTALIEDIVEVVNGVPKPGTLASYVGPTAVPEPATMFLLGSGLIGLAGFARKKFRK